MREKNKEKKRDKKEYKTSLLRINLFFFLRVTKEKRKKEKKEKKEKNGENKIGDGENNDKERERLIRKWRNRFIFGVTEA